MLNERSSTLGAAKRALRRIAVPLACAVALCPCLAVGANAIGAGAPAAGAAGQGRLGTVAPAPSASVTLEQCITASLPSERSATFSAEMTAIPGSARMGMQITIQAQMPGETLFHTIPGLGAWRSSDAGVRTYKYVKQFTNLTAPAVYRGDVRFRWLNAKSHVIKDITRRTVRCAQPDLSGVAPRTSPLAAPLAARPLE